jgi:hypothetical protein
MMARARYRSRWGSHSSWAHDSYGWERAREHIEAARRLSAELGGTDKDVKAYFFALPEDDLRGVLDEYGRRYGNPAREWAKKTIPKWRTGSVQMGGQTAERLYDLLPPRMPLSAKYSLTEALWRHVGPSSKRTLRVGLDASVEDITAAAAKHVDEVVTDYAVPPSLEARFKWLSAGDVEVKQKLLNHLRSLEKDEVVNALRLQLPVLLDHLRSAHGDLTHRLAQIAKVGKHELEVLLDRKAAGVSLEASPSGGPPGSEQHTDLGAAAHPNSSSKSWLHIFVRPTVVAAGLATVAGIQILGHSQGSRRDTTLAQRGAYSSQPTNEPVYKAPNPSPDLPSATVPRIGGAQDSGSASAPISRRDEDARVSGPASPDQGSPAEAKPYAPKRSLDPLPPSVDVATVPSPAEPPPVVLHPGPASNGVPGRPPDWPLTLGKRDDVMRIQQRLAELGYLRSIPDGKWGSKTSAALREFKRAKGLSADDRWDPPTQAALFLQP